MTRNIVTAFHHGFAGGSKNTSRLMHLLSQKGFDVDAFFFSNPHYFTYTSSHVKRHLFTNTVASEVIPSESINNYLLTEQIVRQIRLSEHPILFAANLFPYGNVMLDAKLQSGQITGREKELILHPVGSDIWQIGNQLKSRVKWLLQHGAVNHVVTYSQKFALEINDYFDIDKHIDVLPPILEKSVFFPLSQNEIKQRRSELSFTEDVFIIHHHSSMRRIKCPEIVLDIAQKAAQRMEKCILIMTGPVPWITLETLGISTRSTGNDSIFTHVSELKRLTVYWTSLVSNVEFLMQIANVELNASLHDSFNIALMEAMACGLPVVTSDVVGIAPHIEKAQGGHCFPTHPPSFDELERKIYNSEDLKVFFDIDYAVDSILYLYHNNAVATWQGQMAAEYVHNQFSEERVLTEFGKYL